uniref:HMG box domain-containing protein n=1 Tax=Glossina pallidipes TaxID=7398 RepID=A0A1B0AA15_GLOPL
MYSRKMLQIEKSSMESSCWKKEIYPNWTARTSFFVFLFEYRQRLKLSCKKLRQPDICRKAGKKWRRMSDSEKQPYVIWAGQDRELDRYMIKTLNVQQKRLLQLGDVILIFFI